MTADPILFQDDRVKGLDLLPAREKLDSWFNEESGDLHRQIAEVIEGWSNGSFVDPSGNVWVDSDYLNHVIRIASLVDLTRFHPRKADTFYLAEKTYFRGSRVGRVIDSIIAKVDKENINQCSEISKELYLLIRNSKVARQRQEACYRGFGDVRNRLKKQRLRKRRPTEDEVTREPLLSRRAEFAYLRPPCFYREWTQDFNNGLVVNPDTFEVIRKNKPADEREMFLLCDRKGWSKDWYKDTPFSKTLPIEV